ncbi:MAG: DUF4349 domain-containing protein [Planctomycetes bacterium]|nr:DUF4349 domain-containing protein [Planctomycetota bacterium]
MPKPGWLVWLLFLMLPACMAPMGTRAERSALDDVTDGLADNDPADYSLAGAFFQDGGDGDVRASTENSFTSAGAAAWTGSEPPPQPSAPEPTAPPAAQRLLIQKGEVKVEVARPDDVAREFQAKVQAWGGFLQQQSGGSLVLRLPVAKFEEAFAAAKALGRVLAEARSADDVTEEFMDLGIRLDNARKSRDRLLEILQKAEKIEDILRVETELRRLTEEIERMEGRIKFLRDQVAMATLRVTLQATSTPPPPKRSRQRSRFAWINGVGAEQMLREDF